MDGLHWHVAVDLDGTQNGCLSGTSALMLLFLCQQWLTHIMQPELLQQLPNGAERCQIVQIDTLTNVLKVDSRVTSCYSLGYMSWCGGCYFVTVYYVAMLVNSGYLAFTFYQII